MRTPGPAFDLRTALAEELRAAQTQLNASPLDARAVHQCRVRVKRARALARIGAASAPGLSEVFIDSARTLMRHLARARDPAALAEAAMQTARKARKKEASALKRIAETIDVAEPAAASFNLETTQASLRDLLALAQVWPEMSARQVRKGARRLDRRARRAREAGAACDDQTLRHRWRRREKERCYAADILDAAWPRKRSRRRAEKIAVCLGEERDAVLLMARLSGATSNKGQKDTKRALKALNRRRAKSARRANALAARIS
jgi:hypothetical protein